MALKAKGKNTAENAGVNAAELSSKHLFGKVKFGPHAHKVKVCKKTGFLQWGTIRVFCLSPGSPSGNMPTWAGQDTSADAPSSAFVSPSLSWIIAYSETHLYVRVARPIALFHQAPRLQNCGHTQQNEQNNDGASLFRFVFGSYFLVRYLSPWILSGIIL